MGHRLESSVKEISLRELRYEEWPNLMSNESVVFAMCYTHKNFEIIDITG